MTTIAAPMCIACTHYHDGDDVKQTCDAYPQQIPGRILDGQVDHRQSYILDGGTRFEAKPGWSLDGLSAVPPE